MYHEIERSKVMSSVTIFDDLYDAMLFLETEAENTKGRTGYFKAEIYMTPDGRWRVGIITEPQLDLFDGFVE